jgi:hypothetical protein
MEATTYQEVQGVSRMTVGDIWDEYLDAFGEETRSYHVRTLGACSRLSLNRRNHRISGAVLHS